VRAIDDEIVEWLERRERRRSRQPQRQSEVPVDKYLKGRAAPPLIRKTMI
jgi:hypothetical protein